MDLLPLCARAKTVLKGVFFFFPVAMTVSGRSQFTVTPALSSLQCKGHLVFRNVPPFQETQLFDQVRHN